MIQELSIILGMTTNTKIAIPRKINICVSIKITQNPLINIFMNRSS